MSDSTFEHLLLKKEAKSAGNNVVRSQHTNCDRFGTKALPTEPDGKFRQANIKGDVGKILGLGCKTSTSLCFLMHHLLKPIQNCIKKSTNLKSISGFVDRPRQPSRPGGGAASNWPLHYWPAGQREEEEEEVVGGQHPIYPTVWAHSRSRKSN